MKPIQLIGQLNTDGGAIVSSEECSVIEITNAQADGRFAMDAECFGYVRRPAEWLALQPDPEKSETISDGKCWGNKIGAHDFAQCPKMLESGASMMAEKFIFERTGCESWDEVSDSAWKTHEVRELLAKFILENAKHLHPESDMQRQRDEARRLAEMWQDYALFRSAPRPPAYFPWENDEVSHGDRECQADTHPTHKQP